MCGSQSCRMERHRPFRAPALAAPPMCKGEPDEHTRETLQPLCAYPNYVPCLAHSKVSKLLARLLAKSSVPAASARGENHITCDATLREISARLPTRDLEALPDS